MKIFDSGIKFLGPVAQRQEQGTHNSLGRRFESCRAYFLAMGHRGYRTRFVSDENAL